MTTASTRRWGRKASRARSRPRAMRSRSSARRIFTYYVFGDTRTPESTPRRPRHAQGHIWRPHEMPSVGLAYEEWLCGDGRGMVLKGPMPFEGLRNVMAIVK